MARGEAKIVAGRYQLLRPLGRGGMGVVWHAHDTLLGRDVAVKEINLPTIGTDLAGPSDPILRRALREARAAARLRHPAIITVHDVTTDDGRPWIVMELIDGSSLADAIGAQGPLPEQQAAEVGLRVLEALRAAHRQGILHRDVKPANILLDGDRVVLTDFGIAAVDGATVLTATGQIVGSPGYLAPERINGRPATAAADLWALGVTLYAAVTGRSPFQREDAQTTLAAILTSRPDPPAHAGQLWPVIKGLLVKDPAERLTADQAVPLLTAVANRPTAAEPAASPPLRGMVRWWPIWLRRRSAHDGLPRTLLAPPNTVAAPTAPQQAEEQKDQSAPLDRAESAEPTGARTGPVPPPGANVAETVNQVTVVRLSSGPPRRRLITRFAVLVGALVLVVAAPISTVVLLGRHEPDRQAAGSGTGSPAASTAPAPAPSPPGLPTPSSTPQSPAQCLVGTWRQTSNRATWPVGSRNVPVTSNGTINRFGANGTAVVEYRRPGVTRRGKAGGDTYEITTVGVITFNYDAGDNDTIYYSDAEANGTITTRVNGRVVDSGKMTGSVVPERYRCTRDTLRFWNDQWTIDAVRISST